MRIISEAELRYSDPPRRGGALFFFDEGQNFEHDSAFKSIGTPPVWPLEGAKVCMGPNKILIFRKVVGYQTKGIKKIYKFSS